MAQHGVYRFAGLSSSVAKMVKGCRYVCATEDRLVANMAKEGIAWRTIQKITGRSNSTPSKILSGKTAGQGTKRIGAPEKITPQKYKTLLRSAAALQKEANAGQEVTADMIAKHAGVEFSKRTLLRKLHKEGIHFFR